MRITERISAVGSRVDKEAGVIHDVMVLGLKSKNGRTYSEAVARQAIPLYEGAKVFPDHEHRTRKFGEQVGRLESVEFRNQPNPGLYAKDLPYLKESEQGRLLAEKAERFPNDFGLSHTIEARLNRNQDVVEEIRKVISVDCVGSPATTNGIHEEVKMPTKLAEILANLDKHDPAFETITEACTTMADLEVEVSEDNQVGPALLAIAQECLTKPTDGKLLKKQASPGNETQPVNEELQELLDWKRKADIKLLAESLLKKNTIELREDLVTELQVLGTETLMEARIELWPEYIKHPQAKPFSRSSEPLPLTESAGDYQGFLKNINVELVAD